jgi:hypothetical protein
MAQPTFYQTLNMEGVDPTLYYLNTYSAGGSITPEYPAPPFLPGTQAFGSDGSQFTFVQASTSISLTDFVVINTGQAVAPFQANSISTTNVFGSLVTGIASSGLVLKQSVSFIPAGAFFWACTRGTFLPATNSGSVLAGMPASNGVGSVALYCALTGVGVGILTSVSTTLSPAIAGITVVNSLTISIPSSVCPPAGGTQSNGFTVGPVVALNNVRFIQVGTTTTPVSVNSANQTGAGPWNV